MQTYTANYIAQIQLSMSLQGKHWLAARLLVFSTGPLIFILCIIGDESLICKQWRRWVVWWRCAGGERWEGGGEGSNYSIVLQLILEHKDHMLEGMVKATALDVNVGWFNYYLKRKSIVKNKRPSVTVTAVALDTTANVGTETLKLTKYLINFPQNVPIFGGVCMSYVLKLWPKRCFDAVRSKTT